MPGRRISPRPHRHQRPGRGSVLAGFKHIIETWLGEDARRPRKQRHTAKRVFDRLTEEHGFTGTYSPVQRFVKKWVALNRGAGEGFTELVWPAATMQVDFGQGEAIIAGIRQVLHILIVSFPFSNMRFVQAYAGETAECVCQGCAPSLNTSAPYPRHMVFDYVPRNIIGIQVPQFLLAPRLSGEGQEQLFQLPAVQVVALS
ncbi:transposase [Arthrobacter sp. SDTb3-6]|uniref:transposase n=1 Tax=Arthrobacter sp. SDTb3-6 TaxID=2713571 RepID=UPI00159D8CF8|nr:transposase [Arthrobacter sp. SDTb3-6]NVN00510.1 transposase [Arthrobacter sp. SDTb3-6]